MRRLRPVEIAGGHVVFHIAVADLPGGHGLEPLRIRRAVVQRAALRIRHAQAQVERLRVEQRVERAAGERGVPRPVRKRVAGPDHVRLRIEQIAARHGAAQFGIGKRGRDVVRVGRGQVHRPHAAQQRAAERAHEQYDGGRLGRGGYGCVFHAMAPSCRRTAPMRSSPARMRETSRFFCTGARRCGKIRDAPAPMRDGAGKSETLPRRCETVREKPRFSRAGARRCGKIRDAPAPVRDDARKSETLPHRCETMRENPRCSRAGARRCEKIRETPRAGARPRPAGVSPLAPRATAAPSCTPAPTRP